MSAKSRIKRLFDAIEEQSSAIRDAVSAASKADTTAASNAASAASNAALAASNEANAASQNAQNMGQATAQSMANLQLQMTALTTQMNAPRPTQKRLSGTANSTTYNYTFPQPYAAAPDVTAITCWGAVQLFDANVSNVTATGCTLSIVRSKGTLILSSGPFEAAPSGGPFVLLVWGILQT